VSRRRGRGTGKDTGTAPEGEATGELERQRGTRGEKRRGGRHPTRETNVYERGSNRRRRDALRVVAYRASASAVRRCERDALSRASAVRVSPIAATGRSGVDRRRTRENAASTTDALRFQATFPRGSASVDEGGAASPPAHNDASERTNRDILGDAASTSRRRRDRGVRAKTRGRARRPMPLRGHGRAFPERNPPPLPSSSAASPSRLTRTSHAHTTSLPRSPTSYSRRIGCSTASPRASPGSPSISTATRSSSRVGATPSCVPPPLRAFRESRDATRVSPFPPHRTSLARATLPKP